MCGGRRYNGDTRQDRTLAGTVKKLPLLMLCLAPVAEAADYSGLTLEQALGRLRAEGLVLFYSSDLVRPEMRIQSEPRSLGPRAVLDELLAPHGLMAAPAPGGGWLLVRRPQPARGGTAPAPLPAAIALGEVIVSASHYELAAAPTPQRGTVLTAEALDNLPDIGDDPVRAVARLPGVARADFSSRTQVRGGTPSETLVLFDDLRLYNPYHFKDFFGLFSTVDPGNVGDVTVYTGGFPASFGDRSSGVIAFRPPPIDDELFGRALLSFFSAGVAGGGRFDEDRGDWRVSARRGNMDLIFKAVADEIGKPEYYDLHARVGHRIGDWATLSANALVFDDRLRASDSDQEELARAAYRDEYYWLRLDVGSESGAGGRILAGETRLSSSRTGTMDLPGIASGSLDDRRRFRIRSFQAEAWWRPASQALLQAGIETRNLDGDYFYRDDAEFELLFLTPGAPVQRERERNLEAHPTGYQDSAFVNLRLEPHPEFTADLGVRWDRESLSPGQESDISPRTAIMWEPREHTRFRVSWGQFSQAQGIDELPLADGQLRFAPPQHAEHWVASWERDIGRTLQFRLEAYRKKYTDVQPRYENLLNTLVILPELKPDRIRIAPDSALAKGVEASLQWHADPWNGWLSHSWSKVVDRFAGDDIPRSWDQRHYTTAGLGYRGGPWEFSLAGTWYRGWPTTHVELAQLEPEALVAVGPRNDERLGNYLRFDARAARRFEYDNGTELVAFLEINNLLARKNDCCLEYQLEDEEIPGEVFLDVQTLDSLPFVPSLGVIWKF